MADGYFGFPSFGWDQPFAFGPVSLAPSGAIVNYAIYVADSFKPGIPMLLDEQTYLRNCGLNFTRLGTAPAVEPIGKTSACRLQGFAWTPRNYTEVTGEFPGSRDKTKPISHAEDLTVRVLRRVFYSAGTGAKAGGSSSSWDCSGRR